MSLTDGPEYCSGEWRKMTRDVFHSLRSYNGWIIELDGNVISRHTTQAQNEAVAKRMARAVKRNGGLGAAVLHRVDGSVSGIRRYGKDRS